LALAGFDEAGRGALAGPVVVGAVAIPAELLGDVSRIEALLGGVDDSKKLTPKAREAAFAAVVGCARWAAGCASASEIDSVGIVTAAERAAVRAYRRLGVVADLAVFDRGLSLGEPVPLDGCPARGARQLGSSAESCSCRTPAPSPDGHALIEGAVPAGVAFTRGDMRSLHVAAASIVAKVTRDHLMERLDLKFPAFGFARHKGYGTALHVRAIADLGPSPVHRRTFLGRLEEPESESC
jgi:ribonuclease HII